MLQANRKPSQITNVPAGSVSTPAVLIAGAALDSGLQTVLERACSSCGVVWLALNEARLNGMPPRTRACLIVTLLPQGERRVPADVTEAASTLFPGLPILLLCQEQLVRPSISVEDGRVILIGQPFTEEKISAHVRTVVAASGVRSGVTSGVRPRAEVPPRKVPAPRTAARPAPGHSTRWISIGGLVLLVAAALFAFINFRPDTGPRLSSVPMGDGTSTERKAVVPETKEKAAEPNVAVASVPDVKQKEATVPLPLALQLNIGAGENLDLRLIDAAAFKMGSSVEEPGRDENETEAHEVRIERAFYIGRFEVTQGQYAALMGVNPSQFKDPRRPVDTVSYTDACEFCAKASERSGRKVRLPTEAEWEYACRAGSATPFSFGTTLSTDQANIDWPDAGPERRRESAMVGSYATNPFGLYDMHGNVREWCESSSDATALQVLRGGSWSTTLREARSAARNTYQAGGRNSDFGFRVVVDLP